MRLGIPAWVLKAIKEPCQQGPAKRDAHPAGEAGQAGGGAAAALCGCLCAAERRPALAAGGRAPAPRIWAGWRGARGGRELEACFDVRLGLFAGRPGLQTWVLRSHWPAEPHASSLLPELCKESPISRALCKPSLSPQVLLVHTITDAAHPHSCSSRIGTHNTPNWLSTLILSHTQKLHPSPQKRYTARTAGVSAPALRSGASSASRPARLPRIARHQDAHLPQTQAATCQHLL